MSKEKDLVIVESPAKAKTINKFLGSGYEVVSCLGHIRDLPKNKLGVDINNEFEPTYVLISGKKKIVANLKKLSAKAEKVFLATDMDREGEAISWHLSQELQAKNTFRILFNQVTREALQNAIKTPGKIDTNKVDAQQGRRVLDRLVGYKLSPLLWSKVRRGLSAGRVQSVTVRLLCEREQEIENFVSEEYWGISVIFQNHQGKKTEASLYHIDSKKAKIKDEKAAKRIAEEIGERSYKVYEVKRTQIKKSPAPPFTTSTLQQMANYYLRFSPAKTMKIAQGLYEGQDIGSDERAGLITYMRTDSTRVAKEAQEMTRRWIKENLGKDFIPPKIFQYKNKKTSQDAHEAIRPTRVDLTPEIVKNYLSSDHYKLYDLIWRRFTASQMAKAIIEKVSLGIRDTPFRVKACSCTGSGGKSYIFKAEGRQILFPGFLSLVRNRLLKVYEEKKEKDKLIFVPDEGEVLTIEKIISRQNFTQSPFHYTEATLVKTLEEKGIGRPSTYAPIISTIQRRGYVRWHKGKLIPTSLAKVVNTLLTDSFPTIIDVDFTVKMEEGLDDVEQGKKKWVHLVEDFYQRFAEDLKRAETEMRNIKKEGLEKSSLKCEKCGQNLVVKVGRFGEFLACSAYPACKNTKPLDQKVGVKCPSSGCEGELVEKITKRGKSFYACTNYPDCKFVLWDEPVNDVCHHCGNLYLVKKDKGGLKCPQCGENVKNTKVEEINLNGIIHQIITLRKFSRANNA
ncbi:type I DNA topoisomerase [Candidatus Aerophobetes bacterium]|nr:type I DNA topoisomerase [Candidatus Aerophobetes bacterium]